MCSMKHRPPESTFPPRPGAPTTTPLGAPDAGSPVAGSHGRIAVRAAREGARTVGVHHRRSADAHAFAPTVRVNTFAPGFIETEATLRREDWRSGRTEQLRSMTPMKHIPVPAEIAGTALLLATDDARQMTGGYMVADGGYDMVGA
jgi:NAD(P)-dependent dehydrogenase (short-subunit alcohol dehydrogenase family)